MNWVLLGGDIRTVIVKVGERGFSKKWGEYLRRTQRGVVPNRPKSDYVYITRTV